MHPPALSRGPSGSLPPHPTGAGPATDVPARTAVFLRRGPGIWAGIVRVIGSRVNLLHVPLAVADPEQDAGHAALVVLAEGEPAVGEGHVELRLGDRLERQGLGPEGEA